MKKCQQKRLKLSFSDPITQPYVYSLFSLIWLQSCTAMSWRTGNTQAPFLLMNPPMKPLKQIWFLFFKRRDTTLKVYTLFLHSFTTEIHVDLILSAHWDEGDDTVYFTSFFYRFS